MPKLIVTLTLILILLSDATEWAAGDAAHASCTCSSSSSSSSCGGTCTFTSAAFLRCQHATNSKHKRRRSFHPPVFHRCCDMRERIPQSQLFYDKSRSGNERDKNADANASGSESSDDPMLSELVRHRLETNHKKSFLKSRPRKLAYEDARRWVQANLGAETEEEFNDLVENGNLRTPYIPKRPEEYYRETNEWVSWDHFLRGLFDSNSTREPPSGVKPATGSFD